MLLWIFDYIRCITHTGYKVHATFHLCIPENNMCMRQQLVLNHRIVLSNPTKTTLRNWCICFYYYRFNYAIMHFFNMLDARWSHRVWHVWYLGFFILREKNEEPKVQIFFILIIAMWKLINKIVFVYIIYTIMCDIRYYRIKVYKSDY